VGFDPKSVAGPFDWKRAQGETLSLHLNKHPFTESLLPALGEFTALTGIEVEYNILSEEEYREKLIIELSSGSGGVDVFMTGPFDNWSYVGANWLEPLDDYLGNPALTPSDYEPDDFYPALIAANRWNGKPGYQNLGEGSLWSIPVMVETYILAYRKDWAEELQLDAPKTYQEYYEMAKAMTRSVDGVEARGVTARGLGTMPTIHTGFITGFASYGCRDFDDAMGVTINSPEAVAFTDLWVKTLKESGPMAWTSNTWYDTKQQFESGAYGMVLDCDFFAAGFEDPSKSRVAGKVGYALPPAGPGATPQSNLWTWALGVSSHSRHKLASWLFIQWATSKEQLVKTALEGNLNPSRKSVWNDPQVADMTGKWGNYREVVQKNLEEHVQVTMTPQSEISAVGDRWARALQAIWGGAEAQTELDSAADDITRILKNARVLDTTN
jgi:multiple sugar transport system substrate-binding protein